MKLLEDIIKEMTDEELEIALKDICEWRNTGTLKQDSIIRIKHKEFESQGIVFPIYGVESFILFEICNRKYGIEFGELEEKRKKNKIDFNLRLKKE